jgi:hypothetical protein
MPRCSPPCRIVFCRPPPALLRAASVARTSSSPARCAGNADHGADAARRIAARVDGFDLDTILVDTRHHPRGPALQPTNRHRARRRVLYLDDLYS